MEDQLRHQSSYHPLLRVSPPPLHISFDNLCHIKSDWEGNSCGTSIWWLDTRDNSKSRLFSLQPPQVSSRNMMYVDCRWKKTLTRGDPQTLQRQPRSSDRGNDSEQTPVKLRRVCLTAPSRPHAHTKPQSQATHFYLKRKICPNTYFLTQKQPSIMVWGLCLLLGFAGIYSLQRIRPPKMPAVVFSCLTTNGLCLSRWRRTNPKPI